MQLCLFRWLLLSGHATGCNADPSAVIERRLTALVGHLLADLGDLGAHLEHDPLDCAGSQDRHAARTAQACSTMRSG